MISNLFFFLLGAGLAYFRGRRTKRRAKRMRRLEQATTPTPPMPAFSFTLLVEDHKHEFQEIADLCNERMLTSTDFAKN